MTNDVRNLVEDATFDFTMGENTEAIAKLRKALETDPRCFAAWHALTEIYFSERKLDEALESATKALEIEPEDIHIHTSLSRIHMERGDKTTAEHHGAQARMLGWKKELRDGPEE